MWCKGYRSWPVGGRDSKSSTMFGGPLPGEASTIHTSHPESSEFHIPSSLKRFKYHQAYVNLLPIAPRTKNLTILIAVPPILLHPCQDDLILNSITNLLGVNHNPEHVW
eukprot:TRINITY_DN23009_c0_g1_i1.p1 TRINITY_DN23009_c0_g1~~TRINITY_DN23009_c0_g1_i1.p1  ORF type:complete len:109 (-),score=3.62 TRINITY_DN23009_c0_g1_i1:338-664(-)